MSVHQEESKLTRTKGTEKRLFDKNKDLKRQSASSIKNGNYLKKQQMENAKLQQNVKELKLLNNNLKHELQQAKASSANDKCKQTHLKTDLEQRILNLESKNQHLNNKYYVEKSRRKQMEKELEKFSQIKEEKEKLAMENQTLNHKIEELSGYKQCKCKSVQEVKQLVQQKDKTKHELRIEGEHCHEKTDGDVDKTVQELRDKIKRYQKKLDIEKTNNYKLKRENCQLTAELEKQKQYVINADRRADVATEACKEKDLEIDRQQKESQKQRVIITTLGEEVNDLKHKLKNLNDEAIAFSHEKDQIINDMRNQMKDVEAEVGRLKMQISSQKVTGDVTIKNLSRPQSKVSELERTIETLLAKISEFEQTNATLVKNLSTAQSKISELEQTNATLVKNLSTAQSKISELETTNETLVKNLSTAQSKISELETTIEILVKNLSTAQSKISELETTNETLVKNLSTAQSKISELDTTNETLVKNVAAAQSKISELETTNETLVKNLSAAESKISELETTNETLTGEILDHKTEVISKDSEIIQLERKYCAVKKQLKEVKSQLEDTEMRLDICLRTAHKEQEQLKKELIHTKDLLVEQRTREKIQEVKQETGDKEVQGELVYTRISIDELEELNNYMIRRIYESPKGHKDNIQNIKRKNRTFYDLFRENCFLVDMLKGATDGIVVDPEKFMKNVIYVANNRMKRQLPPEIKLAIKPEIKPKRQLPPEILLAIKPEIKAQIKHLLPPIQKKPIQLPRTSTQPRLPSQGKSGHSSRSHFFPPLPGKQLPRPSTQPRLLSEGKSGHISTHTARKLPLRPQLTQRVILPK